MSEPTQQRVIIDTDPGVDDVIAILLALASPELDILAFITTFGNTDVDHSYKNLLKVHHAVAQHLEANPQERGRFPALVQANRPFLVRGEAGPLEGKLHSAVYFHGRDGLGAITDRHPEIGFPDTKEHPFFQETSQSGVDLTLDLLTQSPDRSITYLAMGPLTTLAKTLRKGGDLFRQKVNRVVIMGGALDVPGNTNCVSEFNFFADPFAVAELLAPNDPSTPPALPLDRTYIFPLDITTPHELSFEVYRSSVDPIFESSRRPSVQSDKSPLVHFTSSFLERAREMMNQFGKDVLELHDIIPVWYLIQPDGWTFTPRKFDVERMGEHTRGMLVVDRRGSVESEGNTLFAPGSTRSEVPARVEVEDEDQARDGRWDRPGVLCVTTSPGVDKIVDVLLKRVWNVSRVHE